MWNQDTPISTITNTAPSKIIQIEEKSTSTTNFQRSEKLHLNRPQHPIESSRPKVTELLDAFNSESRLISLHFEIHKIIIRIEQNV